MGTTATVGAMPSTLREEGGGDRAKRHAPSVAPGLALQVGVGVSTGIGGSSINLLPSVTYEARVYARPLREAVLP
jgi:hypothetical protein